MPIDPRKLTLRIVQAFLSRLDYSLVNMSPIDMSNVGDPVEAIHSATLFRPIRFNARLDLCRGLHRFPLHSLHHPFVATVAAIKRSDIRTYDESPLKQFYDLWQPPTALECLGLSDEQAPGFVGVPPEGYSLPWHPRGPEERMSRRESTEREEASQHGRVISDYQGNKLFGPVDNSKGELEFSRLMTLYESILARGYERNNTSDGDIEVSILLDDDSNWSAIIERGEHRAAVLAALGRDTIPVRVVCKPIRLADRNFWPQVKAGRITPAGAREVFSSVMDGELPPTYQPFMTYAPLP